MKELNDLAAITRSEAYQNYDIKIPKYTWKCEIVPGHFFMFEEGNQPNWFHRKMQEFMFGVKWSTVNE